MDETAVTVREHLESLVTSLEGRLDREQLIRERELDAASKALDRRLDGMNELREQITHERGTYLPIAEYQTRHEDLQRRVKTLEELVSGLRGRGEGVTSTIGWAIGAAGVIVAVIALVVTHL